MKTHEEILEELFFMPENHDNYSAILKAMQQAVDQALMWKPLDADNLPQHRVILMNEFGDAWFGVPGKNTTGLLYFDPAKLKTP